MSTSAQPTSDVSRPIQIVLDGSNYNHWAQAMRSFLKGKMLWRYVTGDKKQPTKDDKETDDSFADRLDVWDAANHRIITWFANTSVVSISMLFGRFELAKDAWDLLQQRYATGNFAQQYQVSRDILSMRQEPGQPISDFHSKLSYLWDQLAISEPQWQCPRDAELFLSYRSSMRLTQFLMALSDDFEHARASLLHRSPLPSLESAVAELISEETRLKTLHLSKSSSSELVHATTAPRRSTSNNRNQYNRNLQGLKTLKVAFHHATKDEVVIHTIRLPKHSTIGDVINDLKTKVELSHPNAELRLLKVFHHKIYKISPLSEKIENINDQYWTLRAEEIPEEEKNLGPHDRLIHVYHFMKDPAQNQVQNFGEPCFLVIHEGETLSEIKVRIQNKLQVPDEEFAKWKFAFLSIGRPDSDYLEENEILSARFQRRDVYGAWEHYLGLEHADNAPKRSYAVNQNRHTFEKPVRILHLGTTATFRRSRTDGVPLRRSSCGT